MAGLLVGSGFFSGTETALFNLSRGQLHQLRRRRGGRTVAVLLRRPQTTLNLLLLGNMIVNVAYATIAAVMALYIRRTGGAAWQVAATSLAGLVVLILLGEVAPKMLAYRTTERWSLTAATVLRVVGRLLWPLLWVLERLLVNPLVTIIAPRPTDEADITAGELSALLKLSASRGLLDDDAHALLHEIVDLTRLRVADVMVPRVDMTACDIHTPRPQLEQLLTEKGLRRICVYDGDVDHILGLIHAKRLLLSPQAPLRELVVDVPYVPVTANIERALLQFRQTRRQVAVAVDEYGGTAGLITLDDILEEIVGDIPRDESDDRDTAVMRLSDNEYLLHADLAIHEWADVFGIDLHAERISTVGGFVLALLGRIPKAGDTVTYRNLRFTVQAMDARRIRTLKLRWLKEGE
jgi:CBS domain containing-hemolysin-like protein